MPTILPPSLREPVSKSVPSFVLEKNLVACCPAWTKGSNTPWEQRPLFDGPAFLGAWCLLLLAGGGCGWWLHPHISKDYLEAPRATLALPWGRPMAPGTLQAILPACCPTAILHSLRLKPSELSQLLPVHRISTHFRASVLAGCPLPCTLSPTSLHVRCL